MKLIQKKSVFNFQKVYSTNTRTELSFKIDCFITLKTRPVIK